MKLSTQLLLKYLVKQNYYISLLDKQQNYIKLLILLSIFYKRNDIVRYIYYFKNFILYETKMDLLKNYFNGIFYSLPIVKTKVNNEIEKFNKEMTNSLHTKHAKFNNIIDNNISDNGLKQHDIITKLNNLKMSDNEQNIKYVSGAIYNNNIEETELLANILPIFFKSNPLHPELFPQISFLEKNVIKSVAKLFNGNNETTGCITSGGTESILCACYAYKNYAIKKGIKYPEIIAPISIHVAFDKAANYFGIKLHKININIDNTIDFNIVKSYINNNTILLACSAPSYAHGLIDDIESFSQIALNYNIPLHVDACLGGFLLPFADNIKIKYDFQLEGVTSISADTHKYGYTPKGSSILLYKNETLFKNQIYVQSKWNGGIYATPTIPGSRSGNNIVFTWAFLNYYGIDGYKKKTTQIINGLYNIKNKLEKIEEIDIIGDPILNVIAIKSDIINIYTLNTEMKQLGWELNELQNPQSLHYCVTLNNCSDDIIKKFNDDIVSCIKNIKNINYKDNGKSIYGSTQKINNDKIIEDLAREYIKNLSN